MPMTGTELLGLPIFLVHDRGRDANLGRGIEIKIHPQGGARAVGAFVLLQRRSAGTVRQHCCGLARALSVDAYDLNRDMS